MKLKRCDKNPILKPRKGNHWESKAVFNPAIAYYKGEVHMLYRAIGEYKRCISKCGYAWSTDGIRFNRKEKPALKPELDYEKWGCEDPRMTLIDDTFYVTYVVLNKPAVMPDPVIQTALASTKDFKEFERLGKITFKGADDKDVVLFPEMINGNYFFLHRPNRWTGRKYETTFPSIWISEIGHFNKLKKWNLLMKPKYDWERVKIGSGTPPIKTEKGWLVIHHGIDGNNCYRVGAFLLDLKNPRKVLARSKEPILEPIKDYEREQAKKIVFPTGAYVKNGKLNIYYGASDKYICLASCNLKGLLSSLSG